MNTRVFLDTGVILDLLLRRKPFLAARLALLVLGAAFLAGCSALSWVAPLSGQLDNFSDPVCSKSFSTELVSALEAQGETPEDAQGAANRALRLFPLERDPKRFVAASSSGVSYWFIFEPKTDGCLLKLYARQKSGSTVSNTITYFAKRRLNGCICTWDLVIESSDD